MKKSFISLLVGFGATLAIFVAVTMPPGSWAVVVGVLLGLLACVPVTVLAIMIVRRQPIQNNQPPVVSQQQLPPGYYPPPQPRYGQPNLVRRRLPSQQQVRQLQPPRPVIRYYGDEYGVEEEGDGYFYQ